MQMLGKFGANKTYILYFLPHLLKKLCRAAEPGEPIHSIARDIARA